MFLNGTEVRHRAAELAPADPDITADGDRDAQRHFVWLSDQSGIPVGTLHNATRGHKPQGISLTRVYDLAAVLRMPGEDVRDTVAAIVCDEDKPDDQKPGTSAPKERPRDPEGPPPRKNGKSGTAPKRADTSLRAAS